MREFCLVAELRDADGGQWISEAGVEAKNEREAIDLARAWARNEAKAQNAKIVDWYALDTSGVAHS